MLWDPRLNFRMTWPLFIKLGTDIIKLKAIRTPKLYSAIRRRWMSEFVTREPRSTPNLRFWIYVRQVNKPSKNVQTCFMVTFLHKCEITVWRQCENSFPFGLITIINDVLDLGLRNLLRIWTVHHRQLGVNHSRLVPSAWMLLSPSFPWSIYVSSIGLYSYNDPETRVSFILNECCVHCMKSHCWSTGSNVAGNAHPQIPSLHSAT
jgi:hypothetical protein